MSKPLSTVLIGCGQVAAGYGFDPQYARYYRYATHAQVLADHPDFAWIAAVDLSPDARATVARHWPKVVVAGSLVELPQSLGPLEAAVIATPPHVREEILKQLPDTLKLLIVEKPLGQTVAECEEFRRSCKERGILLQVNLWRRADTLHQRLAAGQLAQLIGELQGLQITYGGGFHNTGTHIVDCVEMLAGPIRAVQAGLESVGTVSADTSLSALLELQSGRTAELLALDTSFFRELTFTFWGTTGRLVIGQEGLHVATWQAKKHRVLADEFEIPADQVGVGHVSTVGEAFYNLYTNAAEALRGSAALWVDGARACRAARIIAALEESSKQGGSRISV